MATPSFSVVKVCWVPSTTNAAKRAWKIHSEAADKSAVFTIATFDADSDTAQHFHFNGDAWVQAEQEPLPTSKTHYIMDATMHTIKHILAPSSHANQVIWTVNVHSSKYILATLAALPGEIRVVKVTRVADAHTPFTLTTTATGSAVAPAVIVQEDILFTLCYDVDAVPTANQSAFALRQLGTFATLSDAPIRAQRPTQSVPRSNDPPAAPLPPGVSNAWFDGLGTDAEQAKLFIVGVSYELKVTRDGVTKTRIGVATATDTIEVTDIGGRKVTLILPPKDGSTCHWSPVEDGISVGSKAFAIGLSSSGSGIQPTVIETWAPFLDAIQSLEILSGKLHEYFETKGNDHRHRAVEKIIQWGRDESSRGLTDAVAYRRLKKELYDLQINFSAYKHHVQSDKLRLACDQKLGLADDFVMSVASHMTRGRGGDHHRGNDRGGFGQRGGRGGRGNGTPNPLNNKQCAHCGALGHHKVECRGLQAGRPPRTPMPAPVPGKVVA